VRKIKWVVAVAAVAAGMLASLLAAGTANASQYTFSGIDRCATVHLDGVAQCFELGAYSTYTQTQVWINGSVICNRYSGSLGITWCGVGGGNGTGALNIGDNFTLPDATGSYYERMDIFAGGNTFYGGDGPGCDTWGSDSDTNGVTSWSIDGGGPGAFGLDCEDPNV
jgi:hypothetical protein